MKKVVSKYPKLLQSSVNPNNLSLTIKGILVAFIPTAIIIAKHYDINLAYTDAADFTEVITQTIATIMLICGAIRKATVMAGYKI